MMIYEFRELLPEGVKVTDNEYRIIEDVYMYYPAKLDKKDIAELYMKYGMPLIKDMLPKALIVKDLEERLRLALGEANSMKQSIRFLKAGHDPEELPDNVKEKLRI